MPSRRALARTLVFALALIAATSAAPGDDHPLERDGYRLVTAPRRFEFPRDHASHPEYRLEWWYYTGRLEGAGRHFGYQLTFFRVGLDRARAASRSAWAPHTILFAHLALTDQDRRRYRFAEAIERPALGMAGADSLRYRVWVDHWSAELANDGPAHRLRAGVADFAFDLNLTPLGPPVLQGDAGMSRKSEAWGNASLYYSLPRMATRGGLCVARDSFAVSGVTWMDHEFGTTRLDSTQVGWDWFGLRLDGGETLMLYALRRTDGSIDPVSSGTWTMRDGRTMSLGRDQFETRALGRWKSPHSGAVYPHGWRVRIASLDLDLIVAPTVDDQELSTQVSGGVVYWEGSVRITGTHGRRAVTGDGYVELTGYAGAAPGL
jgi:predicted secreted hydrolase